MIKLSSENMRWVDEIWDKLDRKLSKTAVAIRDFIPYISKNSFVWFMATFSGRSDT